LQDFDEENGGVMTEPSKVIEFSPRLFERLQQENADLRKRMQDMIETIRMNEKIQLDFSRIEGKILESRSIEDMVRMLVSEIRKRFKTEFVTLSLVLDREEIFGKSKGKGRGRRLPRNLLTISTRELQETFPDPPSPILSAHFSKDLEIFFPKKGQEKIGSCVILPLRVRGKWIGSLNLGSGTRDHYNPNQATDLLETLSKKVAILVDYLLTHQLLDGLPVSAHQTTSSDKEPLQSSTIADGDGNKKCVHGRGCEIVVAAGAVIRREDGQVLLVRQVPEMDNYWTGKWICPGGGVQPGETIEEAVLREVEEETHLQIKLVKPLLPFERIVKNEEGVLLHVIYIDYLCEMIGGELKPDDDVGEAIWLDGDEIRCRMDELHEDTQTLLKFAGIL
jgi:ADP-ribose pyrophosphatase YjhB (NUDIX family)/uncharacterized protein YigA (DUF484 family)